jgi:UDP-N-acetylmuramyl pentapeptide phosphotransferase/UDP-N-acetylglucosamine-1-phosphate transferase
MGDAGSTVLGFCFAAMPLLAFTEGGGTVSLPRLLAAAGLMLWPFLADGSFTILRRLRRGENILRAHRSHLYQRLVIAGQSHRCVTTVYGGLAMLGMGLALGLARGVAFLAWAALPALAAAFFGLWCWTVSCEKTHGTSTDKQ